MLAVLFLNGMNMKRRVACKTKIKQVQSKSSEDVGSSASCCRTCLSTGNLEPIFCDKDSEKKRSHDLNMVTGLKINMDDGLPQKICGRCSETINIALQFRRTSKKAQKELIKMTTKKKKYKLRKKTKDPIRDDEDGLDDYELLGDGYLNEDNYHDDNEFPDEVDEPPMDSDMVENEIEQVGETLQKPGDKRKRLVIPNASSYKCGTCSKEFRMKATYKAHMRFHTNYCVCETCGKRCRNNHQLQEHKRARHGLGRIHKCAYCEYSSATKEALVIHERRHTGERPYICDHCGATFHRRSNLVQHIAIHLPEKNFQCDLCPKRLKSRKFLQIHKHNAHTGRKYGYLCPVCDHRFEKPNKVRAHVRRVHGLMDEQQGPIVRVEL